MSYDSEFDCIVIGGGHEGLVCAAYLAKSGVKPLVLERNFDIGGGATTVDVTGEGYRYNLHAINHLALPMAPWFQDLNLAELGVEYIHPEHEFVFPYKDGDAILLSQDKERTIETIANISEADAETYREMRTHAEEMFEAIYWPQRFSPPIPDDEKRRLLESSELGRKWLEWTSEPVFDVLDERYESDRVKAAWIAKLSLFGEPGEGYDEPSYMGGITRCFDGTHTYQIARGGSRMVAYGLQQVVMQNGGTVMTNREVRSIDVVNGTATGVTLRDGTEIGAKHCVISAIDPHQTYEDFIGLENLPESIAQKVEGWEYNVWSLYGAHFALDEPPKLAVADQGYPEANMALKQMIGIEGTDDLLTVFDHVLDKERPANPMFGAGSLTLFDETQAPPGKHTAYAWWPAPYDLHGDPETWKDEEDEWLEAVLDKWSEYAPNMTWDNVNHSYSYTPREIPLLHTNMREADIFIGELSEEQVNTGHFSYRTPIDGLYMCGSCTHPGGSFHGATGYNAVRQIHEDLGLDIWWNPMSLRDSLQALD